MPLTRDSIAVVLVGTSDRATELSSSLERADDRFVVEPVTGVDAAVDLLRDSAIDCLLVVGTPVDATATPIVETVRDRRSDLPIVCCLDEALDADAAAEALDAGATDVVRACGDADATVLAHRISNVVASARAAADVERQRQRLDEFVRGVSHDLRNPLTVAQGRLDLAERDCDSDHLEDASTAVDRTLELIADLLTLARQGETPREREPVELSTLANKCWANVETGGATLVIAGDRTILADPSRLKRLFENLFRNATENGDDDVTVTVGEIAPMYTTTRAEAVMPSGFFVEDDGPGIPRDDRERVFEIGYTTNDDGTGFGLNIARDIATAHGWDIDVSEGASGGARFEITGVDDA
ncbi:HAMP domain-containing sensor histidine kinase [Halorubrum sp. BV1]|uniref:sensor histidine kinase n=1 Tax=Halorubrum sp. BV1 TaxID=1498500 RepID=UPI00067892BE|nr:HAMP domain-containing sensor histidine kinase [Halorubrum sp. BV1]